MKATTRDFEKIRSEINRNMDSLFTNILDLDEDGPYSVSNQVLQSNLDELQANVKLASQSINRIITLNH